MKKLRNAFVHYDFEGLIDTSILDSRDYTFLLNALLESRIEMSLIQYESFLSTLISKAISALKKITGFPPYNPSRNVFKS